MEKESTMEITGNWTTIQDELLISAVNMHGLEWGKVCKDVDHSVSSCRERWQEIINASPRVIGPWSKAEDNLVTYLKTKNPNMPWCDLADQFPGRTGKQCRERWLGHLSPNVVKGPFSEEEKSIIIDTQLNMGNKWTAIAKLLKNRTDNDVKNWWYSYHRTHTTPQKKENVDNNQSYGSLNNDNNNNNKNMNNNKTNGNNKNSKNGTLFNRKMSGVMDKGLANDAMNGPAGRNNSNTSKTKRSKKSDASLKTAKNKNGSGVGGGTKAVKKYCSKINKSTKQGRIKKENVAPKTLSNKAGIKKRKTQLNKNSPVMKDIDEAALKQQQHILSQRQQNKQQSHTQQQQLRHGRQNSAGQNSSSDHARTPLIHSTDIGNSNCNINCNTVQSNDSNHLSLSNNNNYFVHNQIDSTIGTGIQKENNGSDGNRSHRNKENGQTENQASSMSSSIDDHEDGVTQSESMSDSFGYGPQQQQPFTSHSSKPPSSLSSFNHSETYVQQEVFSYPQQQQQHAPQQNMGLQQPAYPANRRFSEPQQQQQQHYVHCQQQVPYTPLQQSQSFTQGSNSSSNFCNIINYQGGPLPSHQQKHHPHPHSHQDYQDYQDHQPSRSSSEPQVQYFPSQSTLNELDVNQQQQHEHQQKQLPTSKPKKSKSKSKLNGQDSSYQKNDTTTTTTNNNNDNNNDNNQFSDQSYRHQQQQPIEIPHPLSIIQQQNIQQHHHQQLLHQRSHSLPEQLSGPPPVQLQPHYQHYPHPYQLQQMRFHAQRSHPQQQREGFFSHHEQNEQHLDQHQHQDVMAMNSNHHHYAYSQPPPPHVHPSNYIDESGTNLHNNVSNFNSTDPGGENYHESYNNGINNNHITTRNDNEQEHLDYKDDGIHYDEELHHRQSNSKYGDDSPFIDSHLDTPNNSNSENNSPQSPRSPGERKTMLDVTENVQAMKERHHYIHDKVNHRLRGSSKKDDFSENEKCNSQVVDPKVPSSNGGKLGQQGNHVSKSNNNSLSYSYPNENEPQEHVRNLNDGRGIQNICANNSSNNNNNNHINCSNDNLIGHAVNPTKQHVRNTSTFENMHIVEEGNGSVADGKSRAYKNSNLIRKNDNDDDDPSRNSMHNRKRRNIDETGPHENSSYPSPPSNHLLQYNHQHQVQHHQLQQQLLQQHQQLQLQLESQQHHGDSAVELNETDQPEHTQLPSTTSLSHTSQAANSVEEKPVTTDSYVQETSLEYQGNNENNGCNDVPTQSQEVLTSHDGNDDGHSHNGFDGKNEKDNVKEVSTVTSMNGVDHSPSPQNSIGDGDNNDYSNNDVNPLDIFSYFVLQMKE